MPTVFYRYVRSYIMSLIKSIGGVPIDDRALSYTLVPQEDNSQFGTILVVCR
jgi:hypothetical protein